MKHIPGLCQHIANLSLGSFQETCPWNVAMNENILGDTVTRIFVYLGVDAPCAAVEVRPHQPVPCGGVEEELLPIHLLPNGPSVYERSRHLGKP